MLKFVLKSEDPPLVSAFIVLSNLCGQNYKPLLATKCRTFCAFLWHLCQSDILRSPIRCDLIKKPISVRFDKKSKVTQLCFPSQTRAMNLYLHP